MIKKKEQKKIIKTQPKSETRRVHPQIEIPQELLDQIPPIPKEP